jgi:hypothetical protein
MTVLLSLLLSVAAAQEQGEAMEVAVVAARDLPVDSVVQEQDLYAIEVPSRILPEGVVGHPDDVVGHRVDVPIFANELVHARWLGPEVDAPHAAVPPGWLLVALGAPVVEVGSRHDVVPEREDCALLRDVVSAWDAPAAVAVRPEQVADALALSDAPLRLMPVEEDRAACD